MTEAQEKAAVLLNSAMKRDNLPLLNLEVIGKPEVSPISPMNSSATASSPKSMKRDNRPPLLNPEVIGLPEVSPISPMYSSATASSPKLFLSIDTLEEHSVGPLNINQCPAYEKFLLNNGLSTETVYIASPSIKTQSPPVTCQGSVCSAAVMNRNSPAGDFIDKDVSLETRIMEAQDYIKLYYQENKLGNVEMEERISQVLAEIRNSGTYQQTFPELEYGVKVAWRNSSRCIYRIQWRKIKVFDCREVKSAEGMFKAVCDHLKFATNNGSIRTTMTVFPQRLLGQRGPRIWNPQLLRYAGYILDDETVLGDPAHVEITLVCIENGWEPPSPRTPFDILPLLIECDGNLICKTIPPELCAQVDIEHPANPNFKKLGLKWHAVPAISSFGLTIGGIQYTCAPFNGWYMSAEIASRNLSDEGRYNMLPKVAELMGYEMNNRKLWKDKALIEMNLAVIYSFDKSKVSIVDHHSASESFMIHLKKEAEKQRYVPGDWIWLVPPISGGVTPVFHQEMLNVYQKPNFLPFESPSHISFHTRKLTSLSLRNYFKSNRRQSLRFEEFEQGVEIIYATETGTALRFAQEMSKIVLKTTSKCYVKSIDEISLLELANNSNSKLYMFFISTFGDGDVPSSANSLKDELESCQDSKLLSNLTFVCFGLGNSAYHTFIKGALTITKGLKGLGAKEAMEVCAADEVLGQSKIFNLWSDAVMSLLKTSHALQIDWTKLQKEAVFTTFKVEAVTLLTPNLATGLVYQIVLRGTKPLHYSAGDHFAVSISSDSFIRTYSISSSPNSNPSSLELTVKLHVRQDGSLGLCSNYLVSLHPGQEVLGEIRACERFRLPSNLLNSKSVPVIMIGAGTGLAPFRGFFQEFSKSQAGLILFGIRDLNHLLYKNDFKRWQKQLPKFHFYYCYSSGMPIKNKSSSFLTFKNYLLKITRLNNHSHDRYGYVSDIIKSDKEVQRKLKEYLLDHNGVIYVCGSKTMGKSVYDELSVLLGVEIVKSLRQNGQYKEDTY